jgi:hypothetical protein
LLCGLLDVPVSTDLIITLFFIWLPLGLVVIGAASAYGFVRAIQRRQRSGPLWPVLLLGTLTVLCAAVWYLYQNYFTLTSSD